MLIYLLFFEAVRQYEDVRSGEKEIRFGGVCRKFDVRIKIELKDKQHVFFILSFLPLSICIFSYEMRSK